jgi:hypothetical protein
MIERRSLSRHPSASFLDEVLVELNGEWQEAQFVEETPARVTVYVRAACKMESVFREKVIFHHNL